MHKFMFLLPVLICLISCGLPVLLATRKTENIFVDDIKYQLEKNQIILPELLYLSQEDAVQKLQSLGLTVMIGETAHNAAVPENHVLTQSPSAGAVLMPGDAVMLTISDGWKEYVPDVTDMPKEKATSILEDLGFSVKYQEQPDDFNAPDTVISQNFEPDQKIPIGTTICLTLSTGRENINISVTETVGNYIGMDFKEAKIILAESNLYAILADTVYDPDIPSGKIISQDILSGSEVPQGTGIQMKISLGRPSVHVPDCTGRTSSEARKLLEDAGLTCMIIYTASENDPLDYIISQDQPADSSVSIGSQIWLTASVGASSYVISTGGWSGNPLPSFTTEPPTDPPTEPPTELPTTIPETIPEIITDPPETVPEMITEPETDPPTDPPEILTEPEPIVIETIPPEIIPDLPDTEITPETMPIFETMPEGYENAPETAPF